MNPGEINSKELGTLPLNAWVLADEAKPWKRRQGAALENAQKRFPLSPPLQRRRRDGTVSLIASRIAALAFAILSARVGWAMAHHPEKALRWFTFGQEPMFGKASGLRFRKTVGWFFIIAMSLNAILLAVSFFIK